MSRIFDPERSIVVVAGAGTGKTFRLVRRYLKIVGTRDPHSGAPWASPSEVAAVTFTRAAADEMRSRLLSALTLETAGDDDEVLAQLLRENDGGSRQELARSIAGAPIGTLHALCSGLLAEFPELCGVPPDAQPLDLGKHAAALPRFVSRFVDRALADPSDPQHEACTTLLHKHSLGVIVQELQSMVDEITPPDPTWIDPLAIRDARVGFVRAQWIALLGGTRALLDATLATIESERAASPHLRKSLEGHALALRALLSHCEQPDLDRVGADFGAVMKLGASKRDLQAKAATAMQKLKTELRSASRRRRKEVVYSGAVVAPEHEKDLAQFVAIGLAVREAYEAQLLERGRLRYDDIEDRTLALLRHPGAATYLEGRFRHLLVDEFQDTNARQVEIIERLGQACGGAKMFLVGDPKQSIYGFRGADVSVFVDQIERTKARDSEGVTNIVLSRRPSPGLATAFNAVFPPIFDGGRALTPPKLRSKKHWPDYAHVPWDRDISTSRSEARVDGEPIWVSLSTEDWAERAPEHLRAAELIAQTIGGETDLEPADVAILVPKWRMAEAFRAALETHGIPAELAGGRGLLPLPEVRDLINLVRLWARDDPNLAAAGVLRGPLVGMSDLGLYALARWPLTRIDRVDPVDRVEGLPEADQAREPWQPNDRWPLTQPRAMAEALYEGEIEAPRVHAALREQDRIPAGKEATILGRLERDAACLTWAQPRLLELDRVAGTVPTADLLARAIVEFRLEAHWLASPRGRRAVANAWKFVELVRALEDDGPDVEGLCAWLDSGTEPAPEGLLTGENSAVTITTYHGAKGKEWPVVCVAGLGEQRRAFRSGTWCGAALTGSDGRPHRVPRIRLNTVGFSAMPDPLDRMCSGLEASAMAAEAKRLLYVAMTRARDRVILTGDLNPWHHLREDDKSSLGLYRTSLEKEGLLGETKPAWLCASEGEYVLSVFGLRRDSRGRLSLRDPSRWAGAVRVCPPELEVAQEPPAVESQAGAEGQGSADAPAQHGLPELVPAPREWLDWRAGPPIPTIYPATAPRHELEARIARWDLPAPRLDPIAHPTDLDPRALGDLFHSAMERWNFEGPSPSSDQCSKLAGRAFPGRGPAVGAWLEQTLARFEQHEILEELRAARARNALFHEVAVDALSDGSEGQRRIRGRIDLLWQSEEGLWNVLDYKVTTRVTEVSELEELSLEYGPQLQLYRELLSRWRPNGEVAWLDRFGLYLAPAGRCMWVADWG